MRHSSINGTNPAKITPMKSVSNSFVRPSELLADKDKFDGEDVKVFAYYIPHHDGDWITEVNGAYEESTISVPNTGRVDIELIGGRVIDHPSQLNWGNSGRPVIIEGKFYKDGIKHHMGITMRGIAMIHRSRIVEIDSRSKEWLCLYQ